MSDEATKLKLAQDLVKDGEYEQARTILNSLPDNPTAQKWLDQLNQRHPDQKSSFEDAQLQKAQELIESEQYTEASTILKTIIHNEPAQKWLDRIENLEKSSSSVNNLRAELPSVTASGFPIPPAIHTALQDNIISRLGDLNGTIAVGAIAFGVLSAVLHTINPTDGFVVAILNALLFGGFAYALSLGLALSYPDIPKNTLFAFIGFSAISILIGFLILNSTSSNLIRWLVYAVIGGGMAGILSRVNNKTNTLTSTAISQSLMPLTAIALALLLHSRTSLVASTFITKFGGLGLGGLVGGLLGGLIVGALLSAIIVISLRESK